MRPRRRAVIAYRVITLAERDEELYAPMYRYITGRTSFPWIAANRTPSKLAALCAAAALSDFDIEINIPPCARTRPRDIHTRRGSSCDARKKHVHIHLK